MKKRLLSFLLTAVMALSLMPATAFAVDLPEGATWLVHEDDNYVWYKLKDDNTNLTIGGSGAMPDFANDNGQPWVDKKANIQSVVIEPGVTNIGNNAFARCTSLASITIPDSVENIGQRAFDRSGLLNVEIPASVTNIGAEVFNQCTSLASIKVNDANTVFASVDGVLFSYDKSTLFCYPPAKADTKYTIPNTVTSISNRAFQYCSNLKKVEIPSAVENIGSYAFAYCGNLTSVEIPKNVTEIKEFTFYKCTKLAAVKISSSVKKILNSAFKECSNLGSVTVCSTTPPTLRVDVFTGCAIELINVPQESVDAYEAADGWKDYAENIVGAKIHDGVIFTAWGDGVGQATTLPAIAGNYYLTTNVAITSTWNVPESNAAVNLCLNGYVIQADTRASSFSAITISEGATLNLYDCGSTEHEGYIDADGLWHLGAIPQGELNCTEKTITGGIITGGNCNDGAGVLVNAGGAFNMLGGAISGNVARNCGGGVNVQGTFNMQDGIIEYNRVVPNNDCWGGGGIAIYHTGISTLSGGLIQHNSSTVNGGGVLLLYWKDNNQQIVTMSGVSIKYNTAKISGGGVCFDHEKDTVILGGNTIIRDNHLDDESENNFYFRRGKNVALATVQYAPSEMSVGLSGKNVADVKVTNATSEDDEKYFFSDNTAYAVKYESNQLKLVNACSITNDAKEADKETKHGYIEVASSAYEGQTVHITVHTNAGYKLKSLVVSDSSIKLASTSATNYVFTMPAVNVTVSAIFEAVEIPAPPAPVYYGDVTYYDVLTSAGVNGTIDVDKKSASYGSTVTVTVTPEKGFALETLTVLDKNGKEIEVKDTKEKNKYTFRMPSSKVTVNATFMEDNTMLNYCVDVKKEDYFYDSVLWAYENEICKGTDELHFSPAKTLTRAEAVTFLWRIAGKPVVNYWMQFKDVESGRYYTEAVRWAAAEKIAVGYSDEKFGTTDLITREQLATMIYGYVQKKGQGFTGSWMFLLPYEDRAKISDWANEAAHWCSMKGVINGKDGNLFDPQGTATRAEAVTMLYRFDNLMK